MNKKLRLIIFPCILTRVSSIKQKDRKLYVRCINNHKNIYPTDEQSHKGKFEHTLHKYMRSFIAIKLHKHKRKHEQN